MPLVEISHLVKHFVRGGGLLQSGTLVKAVDDVSFTIEAGETFGLCLIAMFAPGWATAIYAFVAAAAVALYWIGSRRQRPPDAVIAVRLIRGALKRAWLTARTLLGGKDEK